MITHSLIIAVLESYTMVDRQIRLLTRLLPDTWELILVDDGSDPMIPFPSIHPQNFRLVRTFEVRRPGEWTQKRAINRCVASTLGEYIVKSDIDHVFTAEAIAAADRFRGDMMLFHRKAADLREDLRIEPIEHFLTSPIDDIYVMRRALFLELGGYPEYLERRYGGGGSPFWKYSRSPEAQPPHDALIYAVPDSHATYHGLKRIPESVAL